MSSPIQRLLAAAFLTAASACGPATLVVSPDGGIYGAQSDASTDAARDSGGRDSGTPEAGEEAGFDAASDSGNDAAQEDAGDVEQDAGYDAGYDAGIDADASDAGGADAGLSWIDTLESNRNRLLGTYLAFLKTYAATPQSNGLSGANVSSVCDVWNALDPSSRDVFLTLTARLQGGRLGVDGSSMLRHVVAVYRLTGAQGASSKDPGSCGGGEYNRMIVSQDVTLHAAMLGANRHKGAMQGNGKYDMADAPSGTFWRDSHDPAGPHTPFDISDETDKGAPRGQTQFFSDPASQLANGPLGRMDLTTLVDPMALEMDLDYDCVHNSNPLCPYIFYGPLCAPAERKIGTDIYVQTYGSIEEDFKPAGCP